MNEHTLTRSKAKENSRSGWINGIIGVLIFSGSLPATKVAILDFSPVFLTAARAGIAGILGLAILLIYKEKRPGKQHIYPLIIVSLGVVLGYPLLSALALQHVSSAHSMVFVGMLPLSTAIFGVLRGTERPHPAFWLFSILGSLLVIGYALTRGASGSATGNILMLLAIIVCGLGYAEGAKLSRVLGGWQVICWALVLSLPFMTVIAGFTTPPSFSGIRLASWTSLAYISVFSMLVGFIFWYRGLALGGIAAVGQLQLLQPFFGLALAAFLLHEPVGPDMLGVTAGVILCVAGSRRFARSPAFIKARTDT